MTILHHGKSSPRIEDDRLIRGLGRYTGDLKFEGMLHAAMVRSPHAHARVTRVDCSAARRYPGVAAVLTAADAAADGLQDLISIAEVQRPSGAAAPVTPKPVLAGDRIRFLGEPVAIVIAETQELATDAAEAVTVEYEEMAAVASARDAVAAGAPAVWDEAPDNIGFYWNKGDKAACEAAFERSHHVVRLSKVMSRVSASPLEPRVSIGVVENGRPTVYTSNQAPFTARAPLARVFSLAAQDVRIVSCDVGGSFGLKYGAQREDALVLWAARRLGRPVRWMSSRSEAFLSDEQARDAQIQTTLGLDQDGKFTALHVLYHINVGAYLTFRSLSHLWNFGGIAGVYRTPLIAGEAFGVLTHTHPTVPYRGAGRPDATYAIERTIDVAALELGIDPFELRWRNLIPSSEMPYRTPFLFTYDCGDFARSMKMAAEQSDYDGFGVRREQSRRQGRLRGIGIANPIEIAAGPLHRISTDYARIEFDPDGTVILKTGAMSTGTGLETSISEIVAQKLGVPIETVRYIQGDTDRIVNGKGSGSSSGLSIGGGAAAYSADLLIDQARQIAANRFEVDIESVTFNDGILLARNTNRSMTLSEAARIKAGTSDEPLSGEYAFTPRIPTFPNGCHICEVEIDPETGAVEVFRYVAVEDVGTVLNPMIVEGQIHGGVVQGIGQALREFIAYQPGSAQLITGSFMDYALPRAMDVPGIDCGSNEVPTAANPLGVKGAAEAGVVGAIPAVMNAVCNALSAAGIAHIDMPATPARIWEAIQSARDPARSG